MCHPVHWVIHLLEDLSWVAFDLGCSTVLLRHHRSCSTGRMAHRKWTESKQQPSMLSGLAVPGCCLIYFHFLWAIHPIRPVCKAASASDFSQPLQRVLVGFDLPCTPVMTSNNEKSVRRFPSKLSSREESRVICYDGSHDECFGARSALSLRTGGCM